MATGADRRSPRDDQEVKAGAAGLLSFRPRQPGQYTSWAFGRRLRAAGVLCSMGSIGDAYDNAMAESLFSPLQRELLDEYRWQTRR